MRDEKLIWCELCDREFKRLASHVERTHGSYRDYLLRRAHGGVWPLCGCGCEERVEFRMTGLAGFREFVHGHHARGRVKTEEEKKKIGAKNSANMKRFLAEHPERVQTQVQNMLAGHTEEVEQRRVQSTRRAYERMTSGEREQKFGVPLRARWRRGEMVEAHRKSTDTLKERLAAGAYVAAGGHGSEQWRDAISSGITQKYLDGGFEWSRGSHASPKTGQTSHYRSSWELRHMHDLDADPSVRTWEHEPFFISYEHEGQTRRYLPDFITMFADGRTELQEVGVGLLKTGVPRNLAKHAAARELCATRGWTFRLVTSFSGEESSSVGPLPPRTS